MNNMTADDLRLWVRKQIDAHGSQAQAARAWGVSATYLGEFLSGTRKPGPKLLRAWNMKETAIYERDS